AALGAGLFAALGMLTRPTFTVIAIAAAIWLALDAWFWRGASPTRRWTRLTAYLVGLAPGIVAVAAFNLHSYGSMLEGGHGTASGVVSLDRIATNSRHYASWLIETSPVAVLGVIALLQPLAGIWSLAGGRRIAWLLLLVAAGSVSVYLGYIEFRDWW